MVHYANVELVGRLAGVPIMEGNHRKKATRDDGTVYYPTLPEAVKSIIGKDGRMFYAFTVVVEGQNSSDWIQCICNDESILAEEYMRGELVCVQGRLTVRDKKDGSGNYRTNVRVVVTKVTRLVETVSFERVGTDSFRGAPY